MTHAYGEDYGVPEQPPSQAVTGTSADRSSDAILALLLVGLSPLSGILAAPAWINFLAAVDRMLSTDELLHSRAVELRSYVGAILFAGVGTFLGGVAWREGVGWARAAGRAATIAGGLVLLVCAVGLVGVLVGGSASSAF